MLHYLPCIRKLKKIGTSGKLIRDDILLFSQNVIHCPTRSWLAVVLFLNFQKVSLLYSLFLFITFKLFYNEFFVLFFAGPISDEDNLFVKASKCLIYSIIVSIGKFFQASAYFFSQYLHDR